MKIKYFYYFCIAICILLLFECFSTAKCIYDLPKNIIYVIYCTLYVKRAWGHVFCQIFMYIRRIYVSIVEYTAKGSLSCSYYESISIRNCK